MNQYGFHPEASLEFTGAIDFYAKINPGLAEAFISEVEEAISVIRQSPERWRAVDGEVRRSLVDRFPYGLYYTFSDHFVTIWAVMHLSREPRYWEERMGKSFRSRS